MHVLRGNLLAIQGLDMDRLANPHPLCIVQLQNKPAQPSLSHRKGPGALTISRALLAPAPVETAGILTTNRKVRGDEKALRGCAGKLSH